MRDHSSVLHSSEFWQELTHSLAFSVLLQFTTKKFRRNKTKNPALPLNKPKTCKMKLKKWKVGLYKDEYMIFFPLYNISCSSALLDGALSSPVRVPCSVSPKEAFAGLCLAAAQGHHIPSVSQAALPWAATSPGAVLGQGQSSEWHLGWSLLKGTRQQGSNSSPARSPSVPRVWSDTALLSRRKMLLFIPAPAQSPLMCSWHSLASSL